MTCSVACTTHFSVTCSVACTTRFSVTCSVTCTTHFSVTCSVACTTHFSVACSVACTTHFWMHACLSWPSWPVARTTHSPTRCHHHHSPTSTPTALCPLPPPPAPPAVPLAPPSCFTCPALRPLLLLHVPRPPPPPRASQELVSLAQQSSASSAIAAQLVAAQVSIAQHAGAAAKASADASPTAPHASSPTASLRRLEKMVDVCEWEQQLLQAQQARASSAIGLARQLQQRGQQQQQPSLAVSSLDRRPVVQPQGPPRPPPPQPPPQPPPLQEQDAPLAWRAVEGQREEEMQDSRRLLEVASAARGMQGRMAELEVAMVLQAHAAVGDGGAGTHGPAAVELWRVGRRHAALVRALDELGRAAQYRVMARGMEDAAGAARSRGEDAGAQAVAMEREVGAQQAAAMDLGEQARRAQMRASVNKVCVGEGGG